MVKTVMVDWRLLEKNQLITPKKSKHNESVKAFIQARLGSTRLPGKIYRDINGAPMLFHVINMVKQSKLIDEVIVISPTKLEVPEGIVNFVYDGPENDVVARYQAAAVKYPCDYIVRITSDCPLLDHNLIDFVIANSIGHDYGSNVLIPTFPDGMDIEVLSFDTLEYLYKNAKSPYDREHVTSLIRNDLNCQINSDLVSIQSYQDQSYIKLSVDDEYDLYRVREIEKSRMEHHADRTATFV